MAESWDWCLVIVRWLFLAVPWVYLQFVIVEFPDNFIYYFWDKQCMQAGRKTENDPANRQKGR